MRPAILDRLFAPVTALPGIGPQSAKLFERLAGPLVVDLVWHLPTGVVDRRAAPPLRDTEHEAIVTVRLRAEGHEPGHGRRPYRVFCTDGTGTLTLVYFNVKGDYPTRLLPVGGERIVSGRAEFYNGAAQMPHPDLVLRPDELSRLEPIEPVYAVTAGLARHLVQRATAAALDRVPAFPEWVDPARREARGWPASNAALHPVHAPAAEADLSPADPARRRFAYDEILASQLAGALVRAPRRRQRGRAIRGTEPLAGPAEQGLGFALTAAQRVAGAEIAADMARPQRMMRLLQGDVGSGKTVVALQAMLAAVETGAQAALLAPTEIHARQHHPVFERHPAAAQVEIGLLTGREKGRARAALLTGLADGRLPIVVGTHALLQPDIEFRDLALAVIDGQHRFGVEQRLALAAKGREADTLLMSVMPIPRSLMLTVDGGLDISRLAEKPPDRRPVDTRTAALERLDEIVGAVGRALARRAKIYRICPMVKERETADLAAARERYEALTPLAPGRVGLVHGRMKAAENDRVMSGFVGDDTDLLVATTVVEVGADVAQANVIVVEHAERFGLAQLHQLRGRIGRGGAASACLLLYQSPLGGVARRRLEILRETEDGFRIGEADLELRGTGEALGTRQSCLPALRLADLATHQELIAVAHDAARPVLDRDPRLEGPSGAARRTLFRRDEAVQYLRAG